MRRSLTWCIVRVVSHMTESRTHSWTHWEGVYRDALAHGMSHSRRSLMWHIRRSRVAHLNECERYVSHWTARIYTQTAQSHVTHLNKSCHTSKEVTSHIWMSLALNSEHMHPNSQESCHTCEQVIAHSIRSHVTHVKKSRHTSEGVASHI